MYNIYDHVKKGLGRKFDLWLFTQPNTKLGLKAVTLRET